MACINPIIIFFRLYHVLEFLPLKKINLITGDEYIERALLCWTERDSENPNTEEDICGAEAKYFELL